MALEYAVYQTDNMEDGRFYFLEVNKDLAPNLRLVSTITVPLEQAIQDIIGIKVKNDLQDIQIASLMDSKQLIDTIKTQLDDNTARINNLENEDLRAKYLEALDLATIKKNFSNATEIEIQYGRREIISIQVFVLKESTDQRLIYQESSSTIILEQVVELDSNGNPTVKKIVIKSNQPVSGYCLIL